jgi:nicotinamidase-related amidase
MATVREGNQTVLVVVDVQVGVLAGAWEPGRAIANVALAVQRARDRGIPVLWVQHTNHELPTGSAAWQWVPELVPQPGEPLIHKRFNSGFEDTTLDAELARLQAAHIVLAGAATNWCIRATAYGALERGYDLTLVEDAHTTESMELPGGFMLKADSVIRDLNMVITWLRYPGRSNGTARAAALDFSVPVARD